MGVETTYEVFSLDEVQRVKVVQYCRHGHSFMLYNELWGKIDLLLVNFVCHSFEQWWEICLQWHGLHFICWVTNYEIRAVCRKFAKGGANLGYLKRGGKAASSVKGGGGGGGEHPDYNV